MHPLLFKIGPLSFYSYGLMVALGFLFGIILAYFLAKKVNIDPEKVFDVGLFVLLGSIIGARIFYIIFYFKNLSNPWELFMVWNGGLVFDGGMIFGILAIYLACRFWKISFLDMLDVAAPATVFGYAFGRIGCFLNGCCYGVECTLPWAVVFPNIPGLRHPTQIYASLAGLLILAILLHFFYRRKFAGQVFSLGIVLYGIYRFSIEFIRVNPKVILNLTEAQLVSILLVISGITFYGILLKKSRSQ